MWKLCTRTCIATLRPLATNGWMPSSRTSDYGYSSDSKGTSGRLNYQQCELRPQRSPRLIARGNKLREACLAGDGEYLVWGLNLQCNIRANSMLKKEGFYRCKDIPAQHASRAG